MKRTREITIVRYCRWFRKNRAAPVDRCPVCGSDELITVPAALQLIGVSRSMLNRWIADNQVHVARDTGGQFRVCRRSLLERDA